jgi:cysteine desulfurase
MTKMTPYLASLATSKTSMFDRNDLRPIFLDYHSTSPTDPRVAQVVTDYMVTNYGNASSSDHIFGDIAAKAVEEASAQVAELVGARKPKVIFTSGATEAVNLVLQDLANQSPRSRNLKIALLPVEHSAVIQTCEELARRSLVELTFLQIDGFGRLNLEHLQQTLKRGIDLVCVMAANNEIGNLYPIELVAKFCSDAGTSLLCDASQAAGKVPIQFDAWGITYLVLSAHKLYGPKGVGALIVHRDFLPQPMMFGGTHQYGVRPGTLNVPGIAGLGKACRLRTLEMHVDEPSIAAKRNSLEKHLLDAIDGAVVNGDRSNRLSGSLHISVAGVPNDAVLARIRHRIAISTGAACSSGIEKPSHVLEALGLKPELIEGALRIGLGKYTSDEEVLAASEILIKEITEIRQMLLRSHKPIKISPV